MLFDLLLMENTNANVNKFEKGNSVILNKLSLYYNTLVDKVPNLWYDI